MAEVLRSYANSPSVAVVARTGGPRLQCLMRTFFGELVCECESTDLVSYPMSSPDAVMEITALYVICIDCRMSFHDSEETSAVETVVAEQT